MDQRPSEGSYAQQIMSIFTAASYLEKELIEHFVLVSDSLDGSRELRESGDKFQFILFSSESLYIQQYHTAECQWEYVKIKPMTKNKI